MKKLFASMMMTLAIANASAQDTQAQQQQQRPQLTEEQRMEMRSQQAAHKMGLSDEQAKKFAGIYADYHNELKGVMEKYPMRPGGNKGPKDKKELKDKKDQQDSKGQRPQARRGGKGPQDWHRKAMTDQELEQMHKNHFARSRAMLDVQEKYYKKLRTVLTERQYEQLMKMQKKGWKHNKRSKAMRSYAKRAKGNWGKAQRGKNRPFAGKEKRAERQ